MKKSIFILFVLCINGITLLAQTIVANPFINSSSFIPSPPPQGLSCGSSTILSFKSGLTTPNDFPVPSSSPVIIIIGISNNFEFEGVSPANFVSGSYASRFTWSLYSPTSLIGVQTATLPGVGPNPNNPNPLSSGYINIALKVKDNNTSNYPLTTVVNLSASLYMTSNNVNDDYFTLQSNSICSGISGKVYNDTTCSLQGNDDGMVNGPIVPYGKAFNNLNPSPNNIPNDTALYVSLLNTSNTVLQIDSIDASGSYNFPFVTPMKNYFLQLSTIKGVVGNPAPPITFPASWYPSGESNYYFPTNVDSSTDGRIFIPLNFNAANNNKFGIWSPAPKKKINGNVYKDVNGGNHVDGTPISNLGNIPLYVSLINTSGTVVKTDTVEPNGTFKFEDVEPNKIYTVVLGATLGVIGNPAPSASLPFGWDNVSEDCCDNTGNDGSADGMTTVQVGVSDVAFVNFGVHEPLSLGNLVWNDINQDGLNNNNEPGLSNAAIHLFEDANQDNLPDGVAIHSTTTNTSGLYLFDGLDAGSYIVQVIPASPNLGPDFKSTNGIGEESNPNLDGNNNDNGVTTIGNGTYSNFVILSPGTEPTNDNQSDNTKPDNNGNESVDFGFYQPITVSGNVFVDVNGSAHVDGTPIGSIDSTQLFISLIDTNGLVISSKPVNQNGTFEFNELIVNKNYQLILSTLQGTIAGSAPAALLPNGWEFMSEDCCDNSGNDGLTDGKIDLILANANLNNTNFGITCNYSFNITDTFCNQDVIDLGQYEPASLNFTGGAWTHSNPTAIIANPTYEKVDSGTYSYIKTSNYYGCIASGTLNATAFTPDYYSVLYVLSGGVQGDSISSLDILLSASELSGNSTCDSVFLFLPRSNGRITALFDSTLVAGITGFTSQVNNPDWLLDASNPAYYRWLYVGSNNSYNFPAGGTSWLKFTALYNSQGTSGQTSLSIQIYQTNGGEGNISNNLNAALIIYGGN